MNISEPEDLGGRLLALAPPIDMPVDLFDGVRRRARRRLAVLASGATAGAAAVVVGVLLVVQVFVGPPGPSETQLSALLAAGSVAPVHYTGPGIPNDLKDTTLWRVGEYAALPYHRVIVSYEKDGHPCIGAIDWNPLAGVPHEISSAFEGGCAIGDTIDDLGSYGPLGPANMVGSLAYLYGSVPSDVRVVRADVNSGPRLAQRFVATITTPAAGKQRFFVFTAPNGTEHGIDVDLTFYNANGDQIGSRHVKDQFNDNEKSGCPKPQPGSECAQVSATPPS